MKPPYPWVAALVSLARSLACADTTTVSRATYVNDHVDTMALAQAKLALCVATVADTWLEAADTTDDSDNDTSDNDTALANTLAPTNRPVLIPRP
jgi:hypothetical protein